MSNYVGAPDIVPVDLTLRAVASLAYSADELKALLERRSSSGSTGTLEYFVPASTSSKFPLALRRIAFGGWSALISVRVPKLGRPDVIEDFDLKPLHAHIFADASADPGSALAARPKDPSLTGAGNDG